MLEENHLLFFQALANELAGSSDILLSISARLKSKYLRGTLRSMLALTHEQMAKVISECGGDEDWVFAIEDMLQANFLTVNKRCTSENDAISKSFDSRRRPTKFLEENETTLGAELLNNKSLDLLTLPEEIFAYVTTPNPMVQCVCARLFM